MQRVAHSILSGRILLHLRKAASVRLVMTDNMGRYPESSSGQTGSTGWSFKRQTIIQRSFIDTVRDDTETWFGKEAAASQTTSVSVNELHDRVPYV